MKRYWLSCLVLLFFVYARPAISESVHCRTPAEIGKQILVKHRLTLAGVGISDTGAKVHIFTNHLGRFIITYRPSQHVMCALIVGQDWQWLDLRGA